MAKISEVGRSKTQDTPPDHGTNTEYDPLLEGQPVEYIKHVGRYVSSSRNAAYEARDSADNALEAAQMHSRETNIECGVDKIRLLSEDCNRSRLRSSNLSDVFVPGTKTKMGDRAFHITGPSTWNSLPATIWETKTLPAIKKQLKLYLIGNPEH